MSFISPNKAFDVAIAGGGLAGLSLSILLAKAGYSVVLFEKEFYPFHKVCGEYISMESWNFIKRLGLNLEELDLPIIKKLNITSPGGDIMSAKLDMGGFGISRYLIDNELKKIAEKEGVLVQEGTKVNGIIFEDNFFKIKFNGGEIRSDAASGTFGKRSNLDVKWHRDFIKRKAGKLNNYIGVKYHIKTDHPADTIALHNFKNGYCGISKVEDGCYCLCYLTTAQNLKDNHNSVKEMEKNVLYQNPYLKMIFTNAEFLWKEPLTISQISFEKKSQVEDHVLMVGDAAGMITPLCGNGMSMALHGSKIAFENINTFLMKKISRNELEKRYFEDWNKEFARRLKTGRFIQKLFGKPLLTNLFIKTIRPFPLLIQKIIHATHGREF